MAAQTRLCDFLFMFPACGLRAKHRAGYYAGKTTGLFRLEEKQRLLRNVPWKT
jgi:hypothetical protein